MQTAPFAPAGSATLSPAADRLLRCFRATPVRWVVLPHACSMNLPGVPPEALPAVVDELEEAGLVERASYGPLLYIR